MPFSNQVIITLKPLENFSCPPEGEEREDNDRDVDYQPLSRKRSRGGGGEDGDDDGVACSVPKDLLGRLTPLAEKMGSSMRDQLLATVAVYETLGIDSSETAREVEIPQQQCPWRCGTGSPTSSGLYGMGNSSLGACSTTCH